ncbi:hypothetical protein V3505_005242 [Klebsiella pneumoniae]|uniref:hypothetical protein n=1 Tax=Klebsiella pneumoniae TaxID=573 RepID=UPI00190EF9AA|nr:hypothetical protein [Klebsiella pneumoniae]HBR5804451.1 hypothetical protein [Klebsiella pneumoniae]
MTYAIFLLVTAVCAFGLNYLTNKICSGTGMINQSGGSKEGANKQVISSQADSLIKISRIWADFFPANTSNQPI